MTEWKQRERNTAEAVSLDGLSRPWAWPWAIGLLLVWVFVELVFVPMDDWRFWQKRVDVQEVIVLVGIESSGVVAAGDDSPRSGSEHVGIVIDSLLFKSVECLMVLVVLVVLIMGDVAVDTVVESSDEETLVSSVSLSSPLIYLSMVILAVSILVDVVVVVVPERRPTHSFSSSSSFKE